MSVYKKLMAARKQFHAMKLEKTGENTFAKYKYFELGDFLIPALGVFEEIGLCAFVSFEAQVATMTILDVDKPEDKIVITSPMGSASLKGCHEVQNIGAVETYQRRYLWVAALEIVEHDALDATTGSEKASKPAAAKPYIKPSPSDARPTSGAGEGLEPDRKAEIEEMALHAIESHHEGDDGPGVRYSHELTDADEKVYFWKLLGTESKLRATIKANAKTNESTK